jgi:hypothetical protein
MDENLQVLFSNLTKKIIGYLPNLFAGIVLIVIGCLLAWFAKRIIIQIAVIFKLERFLVRFSWGEDFSKADVRYGFYNLIGNVGFFIIFIIFLDVALKAWKLETLSDLLEKGIFFFPKIVTAIVIFGIGWFIALWAKRSVMKALLRENVPYATLIARFAKAVTLLLFSAMALIEIDIAREIVIIGFSTIFITLGAITIVITAVAGKEFIRKLEESFDEDSKSKHP